MFRSTVALFPSAALSSVVAILLGSTAHAQSELYKLTGYYDFSKEVAEIGDVNADGYADFAIGLPRYGIQNPQLGRIDIYSGKTGTVLYSILGISANDQFGSRIRGSGDVNLDGVPDILASSIQMSGNALSGYVRLHSGATGVPLRTYNPPAGQVGFGRAIATGEDADSDGAPDVLVGAFATNTAFLYSSATGAKLGEYHPTSANNDGFGWAVALVKDVNGDHFPEVAIGAPYGNYVAIRSGATGLPINLFTSADPASRLGTSIARLGDVNSDGLDEIAYGAPLASTNGPSSGYVSVVSTASNGSQISRVDGLAGYEFGTRIEYAGDMNLDGVPDYITGTSPGDFAWVSSASNGKTLSAYPGDNQLLGYAGSVAGGMDIDNDGIPNVMTGSIGNPLAPSFPLTARVYGECPGSFDWIGTGCPSFGGGLTPRLDGYGCPTSDGIVTLRISGTNLPTVSLLMIGLVQANSKLPGACPFFIGALLPFPIPVLIQPQTLGSGETTISVQMPSAIPTTGSIYLQALLPETGWLAATNALRMTLG